MGLKRPVTEVDRIRRMLIGMFVVVLLVISSLIAFGVYALKDIQTRNEVFVKRQIQGLRIQSGEDGLSIVGEQGPQGVAGDFVQGDKGDAGVQGNTGQPGITVIGPQGEQGVKGEKGDTGAVGPVGPEGQPGKSVLVRTNPDTGVTECKYEGDRDYTECGE